MTRKQMEQKIEELAAELASLREERKNCYHGPDCCHHKGCTCVHWHYTWQPSVASGTYTFPYQYTATTGTGYNYQITTS